MLIDEQKIRPSVVGDGDVRPAVVVEVGENNSMPFDSGLPMPDLSLTSVNVPS